MSPWARPFDQRYTLAAIVRSRRRNSERRHQRFFGFLTQRIEHERLFKWLIVLATLVVIVLIARLVPWGHYLTETVAASVRQAAGVRESRREIDESWRRYRELHIEETRPKVGRLFAAAGPAHQRLLSYSGMDPEHGLVRWANYNWTILLSSKVFEIDDRGRSYRFRPLRASIWLRNVKAPESVAGIAPAFYIVPDGPGLADAIRGTPAEILKRSRQKTNSWGFRGPEPELDAAVRGLVLGDSYMQGMFIGEDDTPPECLRRHLQARLKTRVSVLNTGVMGYSPEQCYYTLTEFVDRFRPHIVVMSVYANDFGDAMRVASEGVGDWAESKYWLEKIADVCRVRRCSFLLVPVPMRVSLVNRRTSGNYPGQLLNVLKVPSLSVLDPFDDFVNAYLDSLANLRRQGQWWPLDCLLYNEDIGDDHFSAEGARVWARAVGERVIRLLEYARAESEARKVDRKNSVKRNPDAGDTDASSRE